MRGKTSTKISCKYSGAEQCTEVYYNQCHYIKVKNCKRNRCCKYGREGDVVRAVSCQYLGLPDCVEAQSKCHYKSTTSNCRRKWCCNEKN